MVRDWRYQSSASSSRPPGLGGHAELVVNDRDVPAGPSGFGLVLQVGQGVPVGLPGPVRLPGVLLPGGLADGGVQPQAPGGGLRGWRVLARADGGVQDPVGPGARFPAQATGIPVRVQGPDDTAGVGPGLPVQGGARPIEAVPPPTAEDRPGNGLRIKSAGTTARAVPAKAATSGLSCSKSRSPRHCQSWPRCTARYG